MPTLLESASKWKKWIPGRKISLLFLQQHHFQSGCHRKYLLSPSSKSGGPRGAQRKAGKSLLSIRHYNNFSSSIAMFIYPFFSSHIPLNLPSPHFLLAFVFDPISLLSNCSPDAVELLSLSLLCIPQPGIHSRTGFCSAFWRAVLVWYTSTVHVVDLKLPKNPETYTQCRELLAVQVPGMLHCNVKGDTQEGVLWVGRVRPTLQTLLGGSCHSPVGQTTLFKDQSAVSPPRRPMASFHPDLQRCHRKLQQVTWWVLTVSSSAMQLGAFPTPHLPLSYSKGIFPFFVFSHKLAL